MLAAVDTTPTRDEFRSFYVENFHAVWRQLRRLGVREADAADLAHDVLVLAYNHFDEIPAYAHGWLARVCFEMVRNYRRKAAQRRERLTPKVIEAAIDARASDEPTTEVVLEALDRMPEDQRMLLLRYHVREEPLHALAKSLGCARSTVQLRLAAAETAFEGWVKTLLGVDVATSSRTRLFASFSLAGLLPKFWESSEVLAKAQLEGWERLARAIDAAKMAAGAPRREVGPSIEAVPGVVGVPAKLTVVFAVAVPAAVVGMLLGHLGADVASAQTAVAPSLHAATTPISVIADALVENAPPSDAPATTPLTPTAPPPHLPSSSASDSSVPPEVRLLHSAKQAISDKRFAYARRLIEIHRSKWSGSEHEPSRQKILARANAEEASLKKQEAVKNNAKSTDTPKP